MTTESQENKQYADVRHTLNTLLGDCQKPGVRILSPSQMDLRISAERQGESTSMTSTGQLVIDTTWPNGESKLQYVISPEGLIDEFINQYKNGDDSVIEVYRFAYDQSRLAERIAQAGLIGSQLQPLFHEGYQYFPDRPDNEYTQAVRTSDNRIIIRTYEDRQLSNVLGSSMTSIRPGQPISEFPLEQIHSLALKIGISLDEKIDNKGNRVITIPRSWVVCGNMYADVVIKIDPNGRVIYRTQNSFGKHAAEEFYTYDTNGRLIKRHRKEINKPHPEETLYIYNADGSLATRQSSTQWPTNSEWN